VRIIFLRKVDEYNVVPLLSPSNHSRNEYIVPFVPSAMTKETFKHYLTCTCHGNCNWLRGLQQTGLADLLNIPPSTRTAIWNRINELEVRVLIALHLCLIDSSSYISFLIRPEKWMFCCILTVSRIAIKSELLITS